MNQRHSSGPGRLSGFTLIEVAVVLAIIATLLGTLLVPLATQVQATKIKSTDRSLDEVREALLGFAMTNGRLPCPDSDAGLDGIEDPPGGGVCNQLAGRLPYVTLGISPGDAWGRRFTYHIDQDFAYAPIPGNPCSGADAVLGLCDVGGLTVNGRVPATKAAQLLGNQSIAVVVSHGPNGFGGVDLQGVAMPAPAAGSDEAENADLAADNIYVRRTQSLPVAACSDTVVGTPFCEFDDRLLWLSSNVFFNRLVTAGVLP